MTDPDYLALVAAIREEPGDDLRRLVAADRLQEKGEEERAEFVRVQVALHNKPCPAFMYSCHENGAIRCECPDHGGRFDAARRREIELVEAGAVGPHRTYAISRETCVVAVNLGDAVTELDYRRGFVHRVSGPLAAFGEDRGDCKACNGTGNASGRRPAARHDAQCPECKATGGNRVWVPAPAFAELVKREPLPDDAVTVTDRVPARYDGSELRVWYRDSGDPQRRHPESARLPDALFDQLTGWEDGGMREGRWKTFTDKTAMPALSPALVRAAREFN